MNIAVKRSSIIILVLLALIIIAGLSISNDYSVTRRIEIDAPLSKIEPLIVDLAQWPNWSPWEQVDPSMQVTLGNISKGVGASRSWTGEHNTGSMRFTQLIPGEMLAYTMQFGDDPTVHYSELHYQEHNGRTIVEWSMSGEMNFPVVGSFFAALMDGWIGPLFDDGLQRLKKTAEAKT